MIAALALISISWINQSSADCCYPKNAVTHVCLGTPQEEEIKLDGILGPLDTRVYWIRNYEDKLRPKCLTRFCNDGGVVYGLHCGVGKCNALGCSCEGGCRKNKGVSLDDMKKNWLNEKGLVIQVEHAAL